MDELSPHGKIQLATLDLVDEPDGVYPEIADGIAEAIRQGSKHLTTASRFVFLDCLSGRLGAMADEVRAETRDEEPP